MWVPRVLAVVACVLLPLSILSTWVAGVVTDTDRYVATVGPLASDPEVQRAVESRVEALALEHIDVEGRVGSLTALLQDRGLEGLDRWLLGHADELAASARELVEDAVHRAVVRVVEGEEFRPAWDAANRSAHTQMVAVLSSDTSAVDSTGGVSVQLATVLNSVFAILVTEGLLSPEQVPEVDASFQLMDADRLERAQAAYSLLDTLGFWLPLVWLGVVVLAVALARSRRTIVGWLGWGSVIALAVLALLLVWARSWVVGAVGDAAEQDLVEAVWGILLTQLRTAVVVGLVVALGALVARRVLDARSRRTDPT